MDARGSPSWVLGNHPEDQLPHFLRSRPSPEARPGSRDQPPIHMESGPVPADYGFGRDDDERVLPSRPDPPSDYPEELIEDAKARARKSTFQHGELLTQREILKKEAAPPAREANQRSEAELDEAKHGQEL